MHMSFPLMLWCTCCDCKCGFCTHLLGCCILDMFCCTAALQMNGEAWYLAPVCDSLLESAFDTVVLSAALSTTSAASSAAEAVASTLASLSGKGTNTICDGSCPSAMWQMCRPRMSAALPSLDDRILQCSTCAHNMLLHRVSAGLAAVLGLRQTEQRDGLKACD